MAMQRHVGLWGMALLGLLVTLEGCSAPSQFILELAADGGGDVPLQFVPDRGVVVDVGDVGQLPDGQVVDVERTDVQLADVVTADAADGGRSMRRRSLPFAMRG